MTVTDSVEVAPSADNGNLPAEEITPVAPSQPEVPGGPAQPDAVPAAAPADQLYELPDGRKVDADTLTKEWKENFLPDYTRKAQDLARIKGAVDPAPINNQPKSPVDDPDWHPAGYNEIIKVAKEEVFREMGERERAREQARQGVETEVANQLAEIRKTDPSFDENALFVHATKYGFRDLRQAHGNMRDMGQAIRKSKEQTAQDIAKRNDPVSIKPGAGGSKPNPSAFSSARDYIRALNNPQ